MVAKWVLCGGLIALAGLGACLGPTHAVVEVAPSQVLTTTTREGRFPNGMRVIVEQAQASPLAGVALAIDAGSTRDPDGQGGLAHLVEHAVFQARHGDAADAPTIEQRLNQLAAGYNGETSHDVVLYHAFAPTRAFDDLLQVFAGLASDPLANLADDAFSHEQQVVEAERGLRTEHVQGQVVGYLFDAIFPPGHPYARPVIGTRQSVAALNLTQARAFVAANYGPKRMTMYVTAPDTGDAFSRVDAAFAGWAGGKLFATPARENTLNDPLPLRSPGSLIKHESTVAAPELWLAWPLPGGSIEERARATSLSKITEALIRPGFTSHPAVAHAECSLNEQVLGEVLSCRLILNDASDPEDVLRRTLAELREGFGDAQGNRDWTRAVQRAAAIDATLGLESLQARAISAAEDASEHGNPFLNRAVLSAFATLDLGTVSALGFQLADRKRTFAMLVTPQSGAAGAQARQESRNRASLKQTLAAPDTLATLALVKRAVPRELEQFTLSNGLTVIAERRRGTPFVTAVLGFHGSSAWASDPALGEAVALSESWQVASAPSQEGLSLRWDEGEDDRHFVARAVAPDVDSVLKALGHERYPHVDWPNLRFRRMLPSLTRLENGYDALASRAERSALFGAHPYAAFAPAARADSITKQAVERYFTSMRRPDNAVLVIVSDTEPSAIHASVEQYFRSWTKPSSALLATPTDVPLGSAHPPRVVIVDKPSTQVDLRFSCLLAQGTGKWRAAHEMLAALLAQRTEYALRDEAGIAYYAHAQFEALAAGVDEISLSTSVDAAHVGQALSFLKGLARLGPEDIGDGSLAWRRYQALEASAFEDQTSYGTALSLYRAWLERRTSADLDGAPQLIASLTKADFETSLRSCGGHAVIVALGERATIAAAAER